MSYRGIGEYYEYQGMGSYYELPPIGPMPVSGLGCGCSGQSDMGSYGFGSVKDDFDANKVWADAQLGGSCYTPGNPNYQNTAMQGSCNAAGGRATRMVQAALSELGYGPLNVNGYWTEGNPGSQWKKFLSEAGLSPGPGLGLSLQGLTLMQQKLRAGEKPGSGDKVEYENVNGQLIPKENKGLNIGGMSGGTLLLAAVVVGGLGYAAYKAGKKKKAEGGLGAGMGSTSSMKMATAK